MGKQASAACRHRPQIVVLLIVNFVGTNPVKACRQQKILSDAGLQMWIWLHICFCNERGRNRKLARSLTVMLTSMTIWHPSSAIWCKGNTGINDHLTSRGTTMTSYGGKEEKGRNGQNWSQLVRRMKKSSKKNGQK